MTKLIVYLIILLPLIFRAPQKNKALWFSFALLFVLFGCQYEMTRDWPVYVERWLVATQDYRTGGRDLEPFYKAVMSLCKPFTYFGYLMICAVFNLWVFKKYLDKYVPVKLAWLTLAIFLLRTNFAFTYIDTNRQTLAITLCMVGIYCIINPLDRIKSKKVLYLLSAALFLAAVSTHTSAVIALPIFFFPWICEHIKNSKYLWGFMGLYIASYFINYSAISDIVGAYMMGNEDLSTFSQYADEISERSKSVVEQGIYATLLFFLIYLFDKFKAQEKPLVLAVIVFISLQGFAMYTMLRALFFYQVYSIYVIPILASKMAEKKGALRFLTYLFFAVFILYCIYSFNSTMAGENMENWKHFQTIFSAPSWM